MYYIYTAKNAFAPRELVSTHKSRVDAIQEARRLCQQAEAYMVYKVQSDTKQISHKPVLTYMHLGNKQPMAII